MIDLTKTKNLNWQLKGSPEKIKRIKQVLSDTQKRESDWSKFIRLCIEAIYEEENEQSLFPISYIQLCHRFRCSILVFE